MALTHKPPGFGSQSCRALCFTRTLNGEWLNQPVTGNLLCFQHAAGWRHTNSSCGEIDCFLSLSLCLCTRGVTNIHLQSSALTSGQLKRQGDKGNGRRSAHYQPIKLVGVIVSESVFRYHYANQFRKSGTLLAGFFVHYQDHAVGRY